MRLLFIHQNFPAQFGHIGTWLARERGWDVIFATAREEAKPPSGTRLLRFKAHRDPSDGVHPYLKGTETAVLNGQGFARSAIGLKARGYEPDLIVAHSGWGSGTFARAIWPETPLISYIEWFYDYPLIDRVGPPTPPDQEPNERARLIARNTPFLLDAVQAAAIHCPTEFQAARFPDHIRERMTVIHDGVDCEDNSPDPEARIMLPWIDLSGAAEIVTYATRSMEPHRGFPEFMRALAILQKRRPALQAVICGEDRVAYGAQLPQGESWKARMLAELDLDLSRVHFTGLLPRPDFRRLLQASHCHVYFTVPFVLSWSLIEAMACAAPIVASDTDPVREVLEDGRSARLVNHGEIEAIVTAIEETLDHRDPARERGAAARAHALAHYDRRTIYPAKADLFSATAIRRRDSEPQRSA